MTRVQKTIIIGTKKTKNKKNNDSNIILFKKNQNKLK